MRNENKGESNRRWSEEGGQEYRIGRKPLTEAGLWPLASASAARSSYYPTSGFEVCPHPERHA
jgi:hypothetical protein